MKLSTTWHKRWLLFQCGFVRFYKFTINLSLTTINFLNFLNISFNLYFDRNLFLVAMMELFFFFFRAIMVVTIFRFIISFLNFFFHFFVSWLFLSLFNMFFRWLISKGFQTPVIWLPTLFFFKNFVNLYNFLWVRTYIILHSERCFILIHVFYKFRIEMFSEII